MNPSVFALLVLACPVNVPVSERDCVVLIAEVETVAECRLLYREIKETLPSGMHLGFPECHRLRKGKA